MGSNDFYPLYQIRGDENYGYTFFENELTSISIENSKKYELVFAGSSWCLEKMLDKGINNSSLLLQGIDTNIFYYKDAVKQNDVFTIFSGGKFELRKGQDIVLKAVQILQQKYRDIILINAWFNLWPITMSLMQKSKFIKYSYTGNNWQEIMLNIYRMNNIDEKRIITLPIVKNEKLREVYSQTDLGLFPNRCEGGTNLVLMEYMACGKPVVASFNTGHKDILTRENSLMLENMNKFNLYDGNNYMIADWEEPILDEIIAKIEYAYFHRDEIKKTGVKAAEDMKKYTWQKTAEVLINNIFGL